METSTKVHDEAASSSATEDAIEVADRDLSMFDPKVRGLVMTTVKGLVRSSIAFHFIFVLLLMLFDGMSWNPKDNYKNIVIAFADLDGGIIGKVLMAAGNSSSIPFSVSFLKVDTLDEVKSRVDRGDFNAALVANPNASANLMAALFNPKAIYDPNSATSFVFDEGRGGSSMATALRLSVPAIANSGISLGVGQTLMKILPSLAGVNPSILLKTVGNSEVNLHPVQFSGMNSAAGLGIALFIPTALEFAQSTFFCARVPTLALTLAPPRLH